MHLRLFAVFAGALLATAGVASAATVIEKEFRYDAGRVRVASRDGYTAVEARGAVREFRSGHPDLPWISERIDLPEGTRATSVEVVDVETGLLARGALIAPAMVLTPGLGPVERTRPDPRYFSTATPQPEDWVGLGEQGSRRGRNVAYVRISPVRWNPSTGELDRVARVRVRLTLEASHDVPVTRERIVREWEDGGLPSGVPTRALGAALTAADGVPRPGAGAFRPQQLPSVLGSPVAYLIITSDALAPSFQPLADWKTQCGVPAVVRTTSFIQQQYPSAADDAERIRLFIRDAYSRWGTKWVLLGGDTDIIPTRQAITLFYGGESIATDLYFSCLDGNWNADGDSVYGEGYSSPSDPGDGCDLLPDVYVGRAPVLTVSDAQTFVNKTLSYEKTPPGGYEQGWLFFAEVLFPQPWTTGQPTQLDGAELTEDLLPLTDQVPAIHTARLYENYTDGRWRPGSLPEDQQSVMDSLNAGYGMALHIGHGYRNVMEVGSGSLVNSDVMSLHNGDKLFNLYAINCTSSAIDFPCIGEAFILNPNGGAVTNVGSTRFDFPSAGRSYQYEYFRLFLEDSVDAVGELQARQKEPFVAFSAYDGVHRWTQFTLLLLGDPELHMWHGSWRPLAVSHPASVALSDSQFAVNVSSGGQPVANARVTAYRAGDEYASVTTDALGNAIVPFRPDSAGSFVLTATAYNAHPYQATVALLPSAVATLVDGAVIVDDGAAAGTSGDQNSKLDAGETAELRVAVRNRGALAATNVTAKLSTTDPQVTILVPTASYGSLAADALIVPSVGFRVSTPDTMTDQREIPFTMTVLADGGLSWTEKFQLTVHSPELRSFGHGETEPVGNGNGRPEVGETVQYAIQLRNLGTGTAYGTAAVLRSYDGLALVTDSTTSFGTVAPGTVSTGDPLVFQPLSAGAKLALIVSDSRGLQTTQTLDLGHPAVPSAIKGLGAASSIALTWKRVLDPDLFGYRIYRSSSQGGTYTLVNPVPTDRIAYFTDEGLVPLTRYYYKISSVDSSGNESALSAVAASSTNPPLHSIFPVPTGRNTPSPVALEYVYSSSQMDIAAGADFLYVLHADGNAPVDADGSGATLGDFSNVGSYYAAGPSIAPLAPGQGWSFICPTWDSSALYVFDTAGQLRPGFPVSTLDPLWSSAAVGDIDGDGRMEIVVGSNGVRVYAFNDDGTEVLNGDNNAGTQGVFKALSAGPNFCTPALADIDGDGLPEIIFNGGDGRVYAWNADGSNVPGFPIVTNAYFSGSPAVGHLDGAGDTSLEIVCVGTNDSIYVFEPDGTRRPGWPLWNRASGTSKSPSPAIADMNNDGYNDIVFQSTNGYLFVYNRNGTVLPPLTAIKYTALTSGVAECSPIVADLNGDGRNDVLLGDEAGVLTAISGMDGTVLPGFPIQLAGEVRGTPAVADIDRDGMTEIVVADWDKNIYVWDYDFPFQPNGEAPWPQFHHDPRRTGLASSVLYLGAGDPGQGGTPVRELELAPPSPNPAHARSRLWYGVPVTLAGGTYDLSIYDLGGRRVRHVASGEARAGRWSLEWDLRGEDSRPVRGGVYFARFSLGGHAVTRKLVVVQ
ncbi:MAG: VCBS repeat-containing protein [Candidatus Eisenbacteria bacterium]|nr:VCBS repeat-containing protein [Candidatus Eisenbacteria bacterium]